MNKDVGLSFWLTQWNWQPSIIIGTVAIIALYIYAVGPLRKKYQLGPPISFARACAFLVGVYLIFLALCSALDKIGDTFFTGHMIQHMILSFAAPPLLLVGIPPWLLQPLLRNQRIMQVGRVLTMPVLTSLLFNANLWIWHAPPIYNAALVIEPVHILNHLLYIGTGVLFWWPLLSPLEEGWPHLSLGGKLAYIFFSDMPMVLLGAGLTFTPPLYDFYVRAPRIWGLSPELDQQLGGLIMWIVGSIYLIVMVSIFFLRWMQQQDRADQKALALELAAEEEEEDEEEAVTNSAEQVN